MIKIYENGWKKGKSHTLGPGYHYKKKCRSMVVPDGLKVIFYENQDRTGNKSLVFYEGEYSDLTFYDVRNAPGVIHVEKCELKAEDMIRVTWDRIYHAGKKTEGEYRMFQKLPVGDHLDNFPSDKIEGVEIPMGITVELYDKAKFEGGSLIFSGNKENKRQRYVLSNYDYYKKVSSLKVRADRWELAGIELRDEQIVDGGEKVGGTTELSNNSQHTTQVTKEIVGVKEESTEENWNVGGRVAAKVETEFNIGAVKTTAGVEVEISGGYGESASKTDTSEIHDSVTVEVAGFGTAKASMIIEYGKMVAKAIRKWRNIETGYIIEEHGTIELKRASRTRIEVH